MHMLSDSDELWILIGVAFVCLFFYNIGLFGVCEHGSALQSAVLNLLVAPLVWLIDMSLYWTGHGRMGTAERWHEWSWLQLVGFGLVIMGTMIFHHPEAKNEEEEDEDEERACRKRARLWAPPIPAQECLRSPRATELLAQWHEKGYVVLRCEEWLGTSTAEQLGLTTCIQALTTTSLTHRRCWGSHVPQR